MVKYLIRCVLERVWGSELVQDTPWTVKNTVWAGTGMQSVWPWRCEFWVRVLVSQSSHCEVEARARQTECVSGWGSILRHAATSPCYLWGQREEVPWPSRCAGQVINTLNAKYRRETPHSELSHSCSSSLLHEPPWGSPPFHPLQQENFIPMHDTLPWVTPHMCVFLCV